MKTLKAQLLTKEAFALFGEVIETPGDESFAINRGRCIRHNALASTDVSAEGGHAIISIFAGQPYELPHTVDLVERHPLGSQAFYPLGSQPWLVVVCEDDAGQPVSPKAFLATADQGINIARDTWHGMLTPLYEASDFLVVDRGGEGDNLEEFDLTGEQIFKIEL